MNLRYLLPNVHWEAQMKWAHYDLYHITKVKKGRPSAGGSHMSGVWGREKPRQAFPLQNLRRGCFEPVTWWLSEITKVHFDNTVLTDAVARGSTTKSANRSLMGSPSSFSIVPRTCTAETRTRISNCLSNLHVNTISVPDKNYQSLILPFIQGQACVPLQKGVEEVNPATAWGHLCRVQEVHLLLWINIGPFSPINLLTLSSGWGHGEHFAHVFSSI